MKRVRMVGRVVLSVGAMLLSGGCLTVGPTYEAPEMETPDAWTLAVEEEFTAGPPSLEVWWTLLDDPILIELIEAAGRENPGVQIAFERVLEARALRGVASSQYFPQVEGVGSADAVRISEATTPVLPQGIDRETEQYSLGFGLGWELDLFGRVRRSVESADASLAARTEGYRDALVVLYAEVAAAYADLRTFQNRIRYAQQNVLAQQETLELTRKRSELGLVPDLDVARAELNLTSTAAAIPQLRTFLMQTMIRISILLGEPPGSRRDQLRPSKSLPEPPGRVLAGIPSDLLRQRPDIRQAERELASQTARIGVATAELYPIFSLPGTFVLEAFDTGDLDGDSLAYGFGPSFRWNLFTAGRVRNTIRAEESRTRQALHAYEETVLAALAEVEGSMVGFKQESRRFELLKASVVAADRSVTMVLDLYERGLVDFQSVLDAQRSLFVQQDQFASSEGARLKSLITLYKALGGGWSPDVDSSPPVSAAAP